MSTMAEMAPSGVAVFSVPGAVIRHPSNNPINQTYAQENAALWLDPQVLARQRVARDSMSPVQFTDPYVDNLVAGSFYSGLAGVPPTNVGTRSAYAAPYGYTRSLLASDAAGAARLGINPPYGASYAAGLLPGSKLSGMSGSMVGRNQMLAGLGMFGRVSAIRHGMGGGGLGFSFGLDDNSAPPSLDASGSGGSSSGDTFTSSYASGAALPGAGSSVPSLGLDFGSNPDLNTGSVTGSSYTPGASGSAGGGSAGASGGGGVLNTISNIFGSVAKTTTAVLGQRPATPTGVGGISPATVAAIAAGGLVLAVVLVKVVGKKRPAPVAA